MIKIIKMGADYTSIWDGETQVIPSLMDIVGVDYIFTGTVATYIENSTGKRKYSLFKNSSYVIISENDSYEDAYAMLYASKVLGIKDHVNYKKIEKSLLISPDEEPDTRLDIYDSMYMTPVVMKEFMKPYNSEMTIGGVTIPPSKYRSDHRVFGLKFADPGIYEDLVYFDFHNFYPNLMLEMGCHTRISRTKIQELVDDGRCKFLLNKLIGRMDTEYSLFYDPEYANSLRNFGRLKLLYYISKCDRLVLTNTDSILAKVSEDFELPDNVTYHKISNAVIKNIGNYVLVEETTDKIYTTGIFNKPEETAVAKLRMGLNVPDEELTVDHLFNNGQQGYLSVNDTPILNVGRKCHYGCSNRLSRESLIRFQNGL